MDLTPRERQRYSRHLLLPEVGEEGQRRLKAARVLCVGAGGLGSPAALYLAAAGIGTLGLVDFDVVDFSNLQRQIIHGTPDVGRSKLESAQSRIEALNPEVHVETFDAHFSVANAKTLVEAFDVIVDGTDNFPARYLVNDACVIYGRPNAWGSIFRFEGQAPCSPRPAVRATAACIRSRRRRGSFRAARRRACSACCRGSSAPSRRPRRSS
jgi:adenylyltransferase/sulfurtransferase